MTAAECLEHPGPVAMVLQAPHDVANPKAQLIEATQELNAAEQLIDRLRARIRVLAHQNEILRAAALSAKE